MAHTEQYGRDREYITKEGKIMYRVERFSPAKCPKCTRPFEKEGTDWVSAIHSKQATLQESIAFGDLIVCAHCENWTTRMEYEDYQFSDPEKARLLLAFGFVNFQEVRASYNVSDFRTWRGLMYELPTPVPSEK